MADKPTEKNKSEEQLEKKAAKTTSTAVVKKPTNTSSLSFNSDQVDLVKRTVAKGATDDELALFMHQAKRTGLDPLARQIYFVKRSGQMTIQTSIDGFRIVAGRSGDYAGQDAPEHTYGKNPIKVGDNKFAPYKTVIKVYKFNPKTGERYLAAVGEAFYSEYKVDGSQGFMWKKMPHVMLAKCAEAQALRKAFPQDLSGIYSDDEMAQAPVGEVSTETPPTMTEEQRKAFFALADRAGYTADDAKNIAKDHFKVDSFNDINKQQIAGLIKALDKKVKAIEAMEAETEDQDREYTSDQIAEDAYEALG